MRRFVVLLLTVLLLTPIYALASENPFSVSMPDYYEQISDTQWYTDEFIINDVPTEVTLTVTFSPSPLPSDMVFSEDFLATVRSSTEEIGGFDRFIAEPVFQTTAQQYACVYTSYIRKADGGTENIGIYLFHADDQSCTFRFSASDPLFFISGAPDTIIDSVRFTQEYFKQEFSPSIEAETEAPVTPADEETKPDQDLKAILAVSLLCAIVFGLLVNAIGRIIYWKKDHGKWIKDPQPNARAVIIDISSNPISFSKNNKKFLTTVSFSDGYTFKTVRANRTEGVFTYQISIDHALRARIISDAVEAHRKEVVRLCGDTAVPVNTQPAKIDGCAIHIDSRSLFHWMNEHPSTGRYELCSSIFLTQKEPVIELYEDGLKTRQYVLQTEQGEDFTGKYFLICVRLGGRPDAPVAQIDGFISDTSENRNMTNKDIGYRMEGHYLRCGGETGKHRYEMSRGQDLPAKGLKYPGHTTPANVRLIGICPDCGNSFCFHGYSFYMGQNDVAYSDDGLDCCIITNYNIDKDTWTYETGGKIFRYYNSFCCPHCAAPYIDYKKHPETKVFGVSGCVHLGRNYYQDR